ncbi:protease modulator HflC, partial [candidate division KSB1 bacterium]
MSKKTIIWGSIIFVALIILVSAGFIVNETEQVIITRMGKPVRKPIVNPGIHFKVPIIEDATF